LKATLTVSTNAAGSPQVVFLGGFITPAPTNPTVTVTPGALDFGSLAVGLTSGPQTVTITAGGTGLLSITSVTIIGGDKDQYLIASDTGGIGFAPGGQRFVTIRFKPTSVGAKNNAALTIVTNAGTKTVALTGVGF
jgi:hypothetical protein